MRYPCVRRAPHLRAEWNGGGMETRGWRAICGRVGVCDVSGNGNRGLIQPPYPEVVPLCPCVGGYVRSVLGEQFRHLTGYQRP
jgi:hypothetical protein